MAHKYRKITLSSLLATLGGFMEVGRNYWPYPVRPWTRDEIGRLAAYLAARRPHAEIALLLSRPKRAITKKRQHLHLPYWRKPGRRIAAAFLLAACCQQAPPSPPQDCTVSPSCQAILDQPQELPSP